MKELDEIVARSAVGPLSDEDREKLSAAVETLAWLTQQLEAKRVSLARLKKLLFGQESEKTADVLPKQEDGVEEETPDPASGGTERREEDETRKKKRKGHGRNGAEDYTGAEKIKVEHPTLKPGDPCPECKKGKVYRFEPTRLVRIRGEAPIGATVYEIERLRCNLCSTLFSAEPPKGLGEEKYDASSASMIALLKYGSGLPFNRLERLERGLGIPLPAATQWDIVHRYAGLISPAYEELIRQAAQGQVLHNDDTGMKILELMGKRWERKQREGSSTSTERTGVFTSGIVSVDGGLRITLFFTGRKHAGENLAKVLSRRAEELEAPIQMCDALSRNMPAEFEAVLANCLAHGRRQFVDVAASFPAECRRVLETLAEVYRKDAEARKKGLSPQERLAFHRHKSRPLMVELRRWFRDELRERRIEPNSSLGEAIVYMKKHWWKLTLFYRRAGAPLDNNVCERALKKAILHRKNAYFYKTENGARVGDLFMSLIYTAELSGTNPFDYLVALGRHCEAVSKDPSAWMPWNYRAKLEALGSDPASRS